MLINRNLFVGIILLIISSSSSGQNSEVEWSAYSGGFNRLKTPDLLLTSIAGQTFVTKASNENSVIRSGFLLFSGAILTNLKDDEIQSPYNYELAQNYPNPFNPSTKIKFSIPGAEFISLKVYDILGNEVATLITENREAGFYEISFDAADLASGLYIYKLTAGSFTASRKMLLIK